MNKKKKAWKRGGLLKSVNGVFQSCCSGRAARREGGAREKETVRRRNRGRQRRKETGTWKTRLFLSSSQLELWKSERGPTWSCTLPEERAAFPSRSHSSEPVAFPNQSLAQPASAPLVYILMNQSDYSGRFWSVSVWCFFSTVTVHSVFVISPPPRGVFWTTSDSAGCWIKVSQGQTMSANLDVTPGYNAVTRTWDSHSIHTWNDGAA